MAFTRRAGDLTVDEVLAAADEAAGSNVRVTLRSIHDDEPDRVHEGRLVRVTRYSADSPRVGSIDLESLVEEVRFTDRGGYKLSKGDVLRVSAIYQNPLGKPISQGAMGIVVGYFLPDDDAEVARLRKQ